MGYTCLGKLKILYCQNNPSLGGKIEPDFARRPGVSVNATRCNQNGDNGPGYMIAPENGKCLECIAACFCLGANRRRTPSATPKSNEGSATQLPSKKQPAERRDSLRLHKSTGYSESDDGDFI
jgi:hypothetical protein